MFSHSIILYIYIHLTYSEQETQFLGYRLKNTNTLYWYFPQIQDLSAKITTAKIWETITTTQSNH